MAANRIPDEIISEILSPALRVSDTTFSTLTSVAGASPFLTFSESSSAYLEVSKSWLRVGTPLLYNVVAIRSTAQAQALAATLTTNPDLGCFIKKLRVEGGYDMHMLTIIRAAQKISDVYLSLVFDKSDNASGLRKALPLLDPVRIIVDGDSDVESEDATGLLDILETCVLNWKRLTQIKLTLLFAIFTFSETLRSMPHIKTLVIGINFDTARLPQHVRELSINSGLKHVRVEAQDSYLKSIDSQQLLYDEFKGDPRMASLLDLPDGRPSSGNSHLKCTEMNISSSSFTYPARLTADTTQEDAIWDRILFFALRDNIPEIIPKESHPPSRFRFRGEPSWDRLAPLQVCKMFARLGLPHLYTIVVVEEMPCARSLVSKLIERPELAHHIQALYLDLHTISAVFDQLTPHMQRLIEMQVSYNYDSKISWRTFKDFAETSGHHLQILRGLQVTESIEAVSPATLALFSRIVSFDWDSDVKFNTAQELTPRTTFNTLTKLTVDEFDESFFDVLACMELPLLETIFFNSLTVCGGASFFQRHGAKLRELKLSDGQLNTLNAEIWRNCASLTTLRILCDNEHFVRDSCLSTPETLPHLEWISFETVDEYKKLTTKEQIPHFNRLINALRTTKSFPALREIQHPLCKWPTTEHGKDTWSKWAEKLLTRDVHLVGPDGTVQPRNALKSTSNMAANRAPDEIISEILSPALRVSDAAFSTLNSVAKKSPFLTFSESTSAYLAVSKSWLRVATPLLYHTVPIRSTAQAQALAAALTSNPGLGRFIKKLRVEGGYGESMGTILLAAGDGITDLYISLDIYRFDKVDGLSFGLQYLNPIRVIIDSPPSIPCNADGLWRSLIMTSTSSCWMRLTQVEMPLDCWAKFCMSNPRSLYRLESLVLWIERDSVRIPTLISGITSMNPHLKNLQIRSSSSSSAKIQKRLYDEFRGHPRLRAILNLKIKTPVSRDTTVSSHTNKGLTTPFVYPPQLAANPAQEAAVWSRILFFVFQLELAGPKAHVLSPMHHIAPLLVCRMFARHGIPHLYRVIILDRRSKARLLALQLQKNAALGRHVRTLGLRFHTDSSEFTALVACMPALTELYTSPNYRPISYQSFHSLITSTGTTLQALHPPKIRKPSDAVSMDIFCPLREIQKLRWDSLTEFPIPQLAKSTSAFGKLVELTVDDFHESFLQVLALMELPSLQVVTFKSFAGRGGADFFHKHGSKIRELQVPETQLTDPGLAIWHNCPTLTTLRVVSNEEKRTLA
ncbi:hypothetical protein R3P38DRAFT_3176137 [Favolaschia claudopus]|uniref:F-box domain-containing protein n=1 Tax=Favolaschia claudopus TaxID=2862362 RepID=A0AAW0D683_9AGAR